MGEDCISTVNLQNIEREKIIIIVAFIFSVLFAWLIPMTMAFLSLILKYPPGRWANIVVGAVLTVVNIFHLLFEQITQPSFHMAQPSIYQLLLNISTVVVTALIVRYAWRWHRGEV